MISVDMNQLRCDDYILIYQREADGKGFTIHKVEKTFTNGKIFKTINIGIAYLKENPKTHHMIYVTEYTSHKRTWIKDDIWDKQFEFFKLDKDEILTLVSEVI